MRADKREFGFPGQGGGERSLVRSAARTSRIFNQVISSASGEVLGFPHYQFADQAKARACFNARPDLWVRQEPTSFNGSNNADYSAKEETTAGYVMDTVRFGRHSVIGGIRWEQNEFTRTNKKAVVRLPGPDIELVKFGEILRKHVVSQPHP